jgi:chromosome segregation ATPase
MTQTAPPQPPAPSWLTVTFFSLLFSVISGLVVAAVSYGKQEAANGTLVQRIADYKEANDQLVSNIEKWSKAYDTRGELLTSAQSRVAELENDRCKPLKRDIDSIRNDINFLENNNHSAQEIERTIRMMNDYQQSLRACYGSTGHS